MQRLLALLAATSVLFCSTQDPPQPVAGGELRARVEARVLKERGGLRESIGHCGLLFDVEQEHLGRFMKRIVLRRGGRDSSMSRFVNEFHFEYMRQ